MYLHPRLYVRGKRPVWLEYFSASFKIIDIGEMGFSTNNLNFLWCRYDIWLGFFVERRFFCS